MVKNIIVVIAD